MALNLYLSLIKSATGIRLSMIQTWSIGYWPSPGKAAHPEKYRRFVQDLWFLSLDILGEPYDPYLKYLFQSTIKHDTFVRYFDCKNFDFEKDNEFHTIFGSTKNEHSALHHRLYAHLFLTVENKIITSSQMLFMHICISKKFIFFIYTFVHFYAR